MVLCSCLSVSVYLGDVRGLCVFCFLLRRIGGDAALVLSAFYIRWVFHSAVFLAVRPEEPPQLSFLTEVPCGGPLCGLLQHPGFELFCQIPPVTLSPFFQLFYFFAPPPPLFSGRSFVPRITKITPAHPIDLLQASEKTIFEP